LLCRVACRNEQEEHKSTGEIESGGVDTGRGSKSILEASYSVQAIELAGVQHRIRVDSGSTRQDDRRSEQGPVDGTTTSARGTIDGRGGMIMSAEAPESQSPVVLKELQEVESIVRGSRYYDRHETM
jgi:hypothetical protein